MRTAPPRAPYARSARLIEQFVVFEDPADVLLLVLAIAQAWSINEWRACGYLMFRSTKPGAGKSHALEVLSEILPAALLVSSTTSSALKRLARDPLDGRPPTVLLDEIHLLLGTGARLTPEQQRLLSQLLAGYKRRTAQVLASTSGTGTNPQWEATTFDLFGPKLLAGLGTFDLSPALESRTIPIWMTGTRGVRPPRFIPTRRELAAEIAALVKAWSTWAENCARRFSAREIEDVPELSDRQVEITEPYLLLAYEAGPPEEVVRYQQAVLNAVARPDPQLKDLRRASQAMHAKGLTRVADKALRDLCGLSGLSGQHIKPSSVHSPHDKITVWGYRIEDIDSAICKLEARVPSSLSKPLTFTTDREDDGDHEDPPAQSSHPNPFVAKNAASKRPSTPVRLRPTRKHQ